MGLLSKTVCSICGEKTGMGAKAILDGSVCSKCRSRFSPYFKHYENLTADEVREHLKYREMNLAKLKQFRPTKLLFSARNEDEEISGGTVYVDENKKQFLVSEDNNYVARNVDLFDYSDFYSISYSVEGTSYIIIFLKVFSKACNSIVDFEIEWDLYFPDEKGAKGKESPKFKEVLTIMKDNECFFNSMLDKPSVSKDTSNYVNVRCPNCGALTTTNERTATCEYCGSTYANPFFVDQSIMSSSNKSVTENTEQDDENLFEDIDVSEKPNNKKGKVALKVALGVLTGGVSLIPDAVNVVKNKGKERE